MKLVESIRKLCSPAYVYLVISVIAVIAIMFQNAGNSNKYCVGQFSCDVPSTAGIFIAKGVYIAFWTFVLNALCKAGYKQLSWFMVLLPFILFFIIIGMILLMAANQEIAKLI
uniref:Uncharacterized protein n=1 Tax=viral metagenome TaxID=1070528 RepID=A0A6C0LL29_9ZZZZ